MATAKSKTSEPAAPSRCRGTILGHSVTSVIHWMGANDFTRKQVDRVVAALLVGDIKPQSVTQALADGRGGVYGKSAELTRDEITKLKAVAEADDEVISSDRVVEDALDTTLHLESDLESFLARDLGQLEAGLRLYTEGGLEGQQVSACAAGRIDLLAMDAQDNVVVIELKAGDADRQVCGQIQAYMGWAMKHLTGGRPVRGIIVAGSFTERAKLAAKVVPGLSLRTYSVVFRFGEV